VPTTYVLNLNAGLAQVLSGGFARRGEIDQGHISKYPGRICLGRIFFMKGGPGWIRTSGQAISGA
jgi:hypothetical protein